MTDRLMKKEKTNSNYIFWKDIQMGYLHFQEHKILPKIKIDKTGKYLIN
jgi:murein L,D-transpeptidase YafK